MADEWLKDASNNCAAAWRRDSKEKHSTKFDTSVTPERTAFNNQLTMPSKGANRAPSDASAGLSNKLTTPSTAAKKQGATGKLLTNRLTKKR